LVDDKIQ